LYQLAKAISTFETVIASGQLIAPPATAPGRCPSDSRCPSDFQTVIHFQSPSLADRASRAVA
jgi:hypothetical protein